MCICEVCPAKRLNSRSHSGAMIVQRVTSGVLAILPPQCTQLSFNRARLALLFWPQIYTEKSEMTLDLAEMDPAGKGINMSG